METTAEKKTPFYQIIIDDILAQIAAGSFSMISRSFSD